MGYQGGNGIVHEYEFREPADVQLVGEGSKFPPYGLEGGESGSSVRCEIRSNSEWRDVSDKEYFVTGASDVLRIYTTSGGYGKPGNRNEERVRKDLADGVITTGFAHERYNGH